MVPLSDYQEQKLEELRGEGVGQGKCLCPCTLSTWVC